jgi:hypothetical protein
MGHSQCFFQPEVTSATVDYKEARAVVWTTPEVKVTEDWQKQWGEKLARHLGTCGFESSPQGKKMLKFLSDQTRRCGGLEAITIYSLCSKIIEVLVFSQGKLFKFDQIYRKIYEHLEHKFSLIRFIIH